MRVHSRSRAVHLLVLALSAAAALAAPQQVETEHYVVVFSPEDEYWAHKVIQVAEEVWDNLAVAYDLLEEYQKIYIYVEDPGDYADGYSIPTRNRVTIGTTALELSIRSSDNWIRNVVTHELAHVFSMKKADKDHFFQNFTLSAFSMYDNPDWGAALYYQNLLAPNWAVEGLAQYESYKNGNDLWDSHRDMFLRMAVLEDDLLDYVEMSTFDTRHGFYPEMTYNQGYSMMLFIDSAYGADAVRTVARSKSYVHFNQSLHAATGRGGQRLYNEWKKDLRRRYKARSASLGKLREGTVLFDGGFWDFHGVWSPSGDKVAFISNRGYDVLYPSLYVLDMAGGKLQRVKARRLQQAGKVTPSQSLSRVSAGSRASRGLFGVPETDASSDRLQLSGAPIGRDPTVYSRVQWSADGKRLVYARWTEGTGYRDVYAYDLAKKREQQITWHARAIDPALSPDGATIAYVNNRGGVQNLVLVDADGRNTRFLTNFNNGTQLYAPCWTPDGKRVVVGIMHDKNRDIAIVNADAVPFDRYRRLTDTTFFADSLNYQPDLGLMLMVHTTADERDPCISPDGRYLYYSSDKTGIFNIYRMNLETWQVQQVTNVVGGAFAPSIDKPGTRLVYTGFHAANYSIFQMSLTDTPAVEMTWTPRDFSERHTDPFVFSGKPKNGQYKQGDYVPRFTFWHLGPFVSVQPAYVTDTVGLSHLRMGANVVAGELHGAAGMGGTVYLAKDFTTRASPSWGAVGYMGIGFPEVFGENRNWRPSLTAYAAHHDVRDQDEYTPHYDGDLTSVPPADVSLLVRGAGSGSPDTLVAYYVDAVSGSLRLDRAFNTLGLFADVAMDQRNALGVHYLRSHDYTSASIDKQRIRQQTRVFALPEQGRFEGARDITDTVLNDGRTTFLDSNVVRAVSPGEDLPKLYDRFTTYEDHAVGISYQFVNVEPAFTVPSRADVWAVSGQFIRSTYSVDQTGAGQDTMVEFSDGSASYYNMSPTGEHIPFYRPVQHERDFFRLELSGLERFPLPGNRLFARAPRPFQLRHFATVSALFGSLNQHLPDHGSLYPLQYRTAYFLQGYPLRDPMDTITVRAGIPVVTREVVPYRGPGGAAADSIAWGEDSVAYEYLAQVYDDDLTRGNTVMYYNFSYTMELFRGLSIRPLGMHVKGIYLSPFFETAALWNLDWRNMSFADLLPFDKSARWRSRFLRDAGLRVDIPFLFLDTYEGLFSFTWARRIDLDDAFAYTKPNGDIVGFDSDRFYIGIQLW